MIPTNSCARKNITVRLLILSALLAIGFWAGLQVARDRGMPFVMLRQSPWSIGIYGGKSPFKFKPIPGIQNPVLQASDVTDVPALFVADPFMIQNDKTWFMFFEVMNQKTNQGDIGYATSPDGLHWTYQEIVLDEPFHLSYPHVFEWDGNYYMIPEAADSNSVRLYKAESFPEGWKLVTTLIRGVDYADPSIVRYGDFWWLFVSPQYDHDTLRLYYSKDLTGPWLEHPQSPVIRFNGHHARGAGRIIIHNGRPVRYAQDDIPVYGSRVHAFQITEMTPTSYKEIESAENPVVQHGSKGWNVTRMHQVDAHLLSSGEWIACVDGYGVYAEVSLKN